MMPSQASVDIAGALRRTPLSPRPLNHPVEACGLYSKEDMREVNETRMEARWFLGKALAAGRAGHASRQGKSDIKRLNITFGRPRCSAMSFLCRSQGRRQKPKNWRAITRPAFDRPLGCTP
jgi:hypothetical protein